MEQSDRLKSALADRYRIERELGEGGMAIVYLAEDLKHERKVAIKVFRPELAAQLGAERFIQEIRLTANLQHPHIVSLYDSGQADGFLYYVMPLVEGESLRDRLAREERLEPAQALRIARQVATALDYAHGRDVVHRDIKPENILLQGNTALVADFGIARATQAAGGQQLTTLGIALGTPAYMSPEQASGVSDVDGRSDLYSLGCVLYEMLVGATPFTADTAQKLLASHVVDTAPPVASSGAHVPPELAAVVDRVLAKSPDDRVATAAEFVDALDRAAVSGVHPAVGPWSWVRELVRRRVVHVLGAYLALGLAAVAVTKWAVGRFVLSPHLTGFVGLALVCVVPAVGMLAFRRGGRERGSALAVTVGVPVNMLAAIAVLFLVFGGKELGTATMAVTLADEEGNVVTRRVPKASFRKNLALFFFENTSADSSLDWLQYGIPWALQQDLLQDIFLFVQDPTVFAERLRAEGFASGLGVPLTLQREISEFAHLDWFLTGSIESEGGAYVITTRLHETRRGRLVAEQRFEGRDVIALIDEITVQLKRDLAVPDARLEDAEDLPVAETFTRSEEAYRAYAEGIYAFFRQDPAAAAEALERAVAEDSLFALGHVQLFAMRMLLNQVQEATDALERGRRLSYKLPEIFQLAMRAGYYRFVRQDPGRAVAVMRMHTELYPFDLQARALLAVLLAQAGENDSVVVQLEEILALDTTRYEVLRQLGGLKMGMGQFGEAAEHFREYADRFPEDPRSYVDLSGARRVQGEHDRARAEIERALLLDSEDILSLLALAALNADVGRFDDAEAGYREALEASQTPAERLRVHSAMRSYYARRGEMGRAVESMHREWAEGQAVLPPLLLLQQELSELGTYVRAGQAEVAFDTLRSFAERLSSPFDLLPSFGYVSAYLALEDPDSLESAIPQLEELIARMGLGVLNGVVSVAKGAVHEFRGGCAEAIPLYQEAIDLDPTSWDVYVDIARCYRTLGRLDEAERSLEVPLRVRPFHPRALYELGLVHRDRGQPEEAEEHLRRALQVWENASPEYVWARRARAALQEVLSAPRLPRR